MVNSARVDLTHKFLVLQLVKASLRGGIVAIVCLVGVDFVEEDLRDRVEIQRVRDVDDWAEGKQVDQSVVHSLMRVEPSL